MSAPTITAIGTPEAAKLRDGYRTLVVFKKHPEVSFWIKGVKPPGFDGGAPIDTTTMFNDKWRSKSHRSLIEMTDATAMGTYNPEIIDDIGAMINVDDEITNWFPDGSAWTFWGFLQKFDPSEMKEGTNPEASITICVTNEDPVTTTEEDPVYTAPSGT